MCMDTLNIIFDNRQDADYGRLLGEFIEQGIFDYKFWTPVEKPTVVESINASHKRIVEDAKERGLKSVIIGEQDLHFTAKHSWEYFLKNKPDDFDIYLCGTYIVPIENKKICGFHLYEVSEKFYDKFLSVSPTEHIDTAVCNLGGDYHFCYPFPAIQRAGYSFNNKDQVNYNSVLDPKDIYNGTIHNIQGGK